MKTNWIKGDFTILVATSSSKNKQKFASFKFL